MKGKIITSLLDSLPSPLPPPKVTDQELASHAREREIARNVPVIAPQETSVRPRNTLGAHLGEHWTIAGKTGSGKTRFCMALLDWYRVQFPNAKRYVLDSTGDGMPEVHSPLIYEGDRIPDRMTHTAYTQVWIPDTDNIENYDTWLTKILYAREPAIVLLDEVASLSAYGSGGVIPGHFKLMKLGRKHGITVLNGTQELSRVPMVMFRQMKWFVQFKLNRDVYELARARNYLDIQIGRA